MNPKEHQLVSSKVLCSLHICMYYTFHVILISLIIIGMNDFNAKILCFGCARVRVVFSVVCVETINLLFLIF